ncbi:hypothetical protein [Rhodovulum strictum]|uniref:Type IV pilus biogenesis protein PilP n=1 Tax=Rhodovulum strictum TaxID=58314 RepID=A0A844B6J6_9RHOB|nr:hypothetical protein [Rhodovulum strictum]MRH21841.1 hypothetical protein [Rhodovulum strictum]
MKPDFALTLSEDGIGLLHRTRGGWRNLGEVSLDDPGLRETLRLMRSTAEGLAGGQLLTRLVIPDSQVLYTTLPLTGDSPAEKRTNLRRRLDGLTPYAVEDLVFDWQDTGAGTARLAVVARETLAEAEDFAVLHGFNPVCFVATPPADSFEGEADFGPTALAATLPDKGETAEPEGRAAEPALASKATVAPKAPPKPAAKRKQRSEPAVTAPAKPTVPPAPKMPLSTPPQDEDQPPAAAFDIPAPPPPRPTPTPAPAAQADAGPKLTVPPAPRSDPFPDLPDTRTPTRAAALRNAAPRPRPGFLAGLDLTRAAQAPGNLRLGLALTGGLVAVMAVVALWSLLTGEDERAEAPLAPPVTAPDTLASAPEDALPAPDDSAPVDLPTAEAPEAVAPEEPPVLSEAEAAASYATTGLWQLAPEPMTAPPADRIDDLFVAALDPSIRPPASPSLPDPQLGRAIDPSLTLQADPPGQDQVFVLDDRGLVAATPEGALTPDGVMVFAGRPPLLPPVRAAEPEPEPAAPPEPAAEAPAPEPAETGAAAMDPAPADAATADDGAIVVEGAPALTPPARPEIVVPVTEGRPRIVPPARPEPAAAPADLPEDASAPDAAPAEPNPADEARADPAAPEPAASAPVSEVAARLAGYRPRLRPADLAPEPTAPPPTAEAEAAPAPRVPGLRPAARPATLAAAAPQADRSADIQAALAAALAAEEEAADAAEEHDDNALAIARSVRPSSRPSDVGANMAVAAPAVAAPAIAAAAATTAPRLPTTASVAAQATLPKAINLRNINLIGVYGSSSDRRALVRLSNGRYEKVKVGDRLDGGRVAAIGESQLRYVKNGRNVVLDLPGR